MKKELMWQISVAMSKPEALSFAKTLWEGEQFYLVKVSENPKARHIAKRERYVVARLPRKGEIVEPGYALLAKNKEKVS